MFLCFFWRIKKKKVCEVEVAFSVLFVVYVSMITTELRVYMSFIIVSEEKNLVCFGFNVTNNIIVKRNVISV